MGCTPHPSLGSVNHGDSVEVSLEFENAGSRRPAASERERGGHEAETFWEAEPSASLPRRLRIGNQSSAIRDRVDRSVSKQQHRRFVLHHCLIARLVLGRNSHRRFRRA